MQRAISTCLLVTIVAIPASYSQAFNAVGHYVVAEIAWQQLAPERRQSIVDTLKRHPRFGEDFIQKMPRDVAEADQSTQDRWIFWQAAIWPDVARGIRGPDRELYDRPTWHYVNGPIYLDASDRKALAGILSINFSSEYPTLKPENEWNIIQATKHAVAVLADKNSPTPNRAVAYCWLFHLVGDSHQPLHSCSLFSAARFPTGDRGGNDVPLTRGGNLHSLWDGLLGQRQQMNEVKRHAVELSDRDRFGAVSDSAAEKREVRQWLSESYSLAKTFAYDDAILAVVRRATPQQPIERIDLSDAYLEAAGLHARERILAAGLRLAVVLESIDVQPAATALGNVSVAIAPAAAASSTATDTPQPGTSYWLNTRSGVRHNQSCQWFGNTKHGRYCTTSEGKACGECGG